METRHKCTTPRIVHSTFTKLGRVLRSSDVISRFLMLYSLQSSGSKTLYVQQQCCVRIMRTHLRKCPECREIYILAAVSIAEFRIHIRKGGFISVKTVN